MNLNLLSDMNRVETPFIIAEIGGVKFGVYEATGKDSKGSFNKYSKLDITYPNFMRSLTVTKINGTVNMYSLQMVYAIRNGDDPNLLEKIFSKAKETRTIYLSYGDLSLPTYIYKREEALITDIKSNIDFSGSKIIYTISCTSKSNLGNSGKFNFPRRSAKPSDVIKEILYNKIYGLYDVFYGMKDKQKVLQDQLIASNDKKVIIEAQINKTPLEYLQYLVNCMIPSDQPTNTVLKNAMYRICVIDDTSDRYAGPYFKVVKLSNNIRDNTINVYNIDVGYPDKNVVLDFTIEDNQSFSIFYDYAADIKQPQYIQRIDNNGNVVSEYSPTISNSSKLLKTTSDDKTWWTNMVNYPISATIRIKGLLRPAILMSYVYIDARFFGNQHYATGYYIITKQVDEISSSGYRTTLSLLKVGGTSLNAN